MTTPSDRSQPPERPLRVGKVLGDLALGAVWTSIFLLLGADFGIVPDVGLTAWHVLGVSFVAMLVIALGDMRDVSISRRRSLAGYAERRARD